MIEVIKGFHIFQPTALPAYGEGAAPSKDQVAKVWMIEEKQTDVNIASQAYRDAVRGERDQVVIGSNDSDLEPALRLTRQDAPNVTIGLIMPLREASKNTSQVPNKRLTPLVYGSITWMTGGNQRIAIALTTVLFIAGLIGLARIDIERGKADAAV